MAHAENTITINRPVSEVFDAVLDGTKNMQWRPGVLDVSRVAGKPSGVGAVFKQGMKGPGGRRFDADYEIVEFKPNERIKFQVIAGPSRPTGTYDFTALGGATTVRFMLDYRANGIMGWLMDGLIQRAMTGEVANLSNLKTMLEKQDWIKAPIRFPE